MYKKVVTDLNFVTREKDIEAFWNENQIFQKSMNQRKEGETYTFYDGENPFCYYRNFIPDYKNTFNSNEFVEAFRNFKNTIWGIDAEINNVSTTR